MDGILSLLVYVSCSWVITRVIGPRYVAGLFTACLILATPVTGLYVVIMVALTVFAYKISMAFGSELWDQVPWFPRVPIEHLVGYSICLTPQVINHLKIADRKVIAIFAPNHAT